MLAFITYQGNVITVTITSSGQKWTASSKEALQVMNQQNFCSSFKWRKLLSFNYLDDF